MTEPTTDALQSVRDRVRPWIEAHRDEIANLLLSLVGTPSVTLDEGPVQGVVEQAMRERGWDVDRWEATRAEIEPYIVHVGEQDRYEGRPNVVATVPGTGSGRSLMLQGHVDVVEPGDPALWTRAPWGERDGDRIYGRGSVDMKGGVVTMMVARQALAETGVSIQGDVLLATTVGEEDGGIGALSTILRGHKADGVLITEPSERRLVIAQGGSLVFRITVPGKSAHGAARNEGESALEHFIPIFQDLMAWERERNETLSHPLYDHLANKFPISVGLVRAGNWASTVPESLVAEGRLGFLPGETIEEMQRQTEARIAAVAGQDPWLREHPPVVEWFGGQFASAEVSPDHDLVSTVSRAHEVSTGEPVQIEGVTYGADMRLFIDIGDMPAVIYGGGDVRLAHAADEYIELDEITRAAEAIAVAIADWCGFDINANA
ncbi:MAG TPA: ArgE/DapE family deacylase [Thermomicrobiales bacterium]|nr:ArgE/DapE family deacylase [Thermomicrobiales bacterium]